MMNCYYEAQHQPLGGTYHSAISAVAVGVCQQCGVAVCAQHAYKEPHPGAQLLCHECAGTLAEARATTTAPLPYRAVRSRLGMISMQSEAMSQATSVFKAMADPNRLRILAELMNGDSCNCELKDNLGLAANLLSHHLKTLEKAGLVTSRRDTIDGRWVYYAIDQEAVTQWREWFSAFFDPAQIQARPLCGPEGQAKGTAHQVIFYPH